MSKKTKPVSDLTLVELTDEAYIRLQKESTYKAESGNRLDAVKKELRARTEKHPADQDLLLRGLKGQILMGPKPNQRKILSMPRLFELVRRLTKLGLEQFLDFCSITLETVESFDLPPEALGQVISEARTGTRSIKAVPLGEQKAA